MLFFFSFNVNVSCVRVCVCVFGMCVGGNYIAFQIRVCLNNMKGFWLNNIIEEKKISLKTPGMAWYRYTTGRTAYQTQNRWNHFQWLTRLIFFANLFSKINTIQNLQDLFTICLVIRTYSTRGFPLKHSYARIWGIQTNKNSKQTEA